MDIFICLFNPFSLLLTPSLFSPIECILNTCTQLCYISHSSLSDNHFIHRFFYFAVSAWTTMEAYCVKCKSKRSMKDEKKVTMKNGRPATTGICSICGTKMFKIGK